ncbi:hypothetical protein [Novosphingobium kunmingense]|nr:hypothetical protein [Novosphingobium kunmingense]
MQGRLKVGLVIGLLAVASLLALAWVDAGVEPVRPLTAPATLPEAAR